ncbi:MAG: superoxide dismutase family protein [Pseudonocardiales bacterium]|nr:superoxide dismutase family protein [Pseudonocardiales bacterium]
MRSLRHASLGVIGALVLSGCSGALAAPAPVVPSSTPQRNVQVAATFSTSLGTATTYDTALVPAGSRVAVGSESGEGGTTVTLAVRGLDEERHYGAHAHAQPCGASGDAAGPHFQYEVDPVQPSVDPAFANPQNEIWLDFMTDSDGAATATATVPWGFPRDRRAQSIVIHAMSTATGPGEAGTAGARAGCVTVEF